MKQNLFSVRAVENIEKQLHLPFELSAEYSAPEATHARYGSEGEQSHDYTGRAR